MSRLTAIAWLETELRVVIPEPSYSKGLPPTFIDEEMHDLSIVWVVDDIRDFRLRMVKAIQKQFKAMPDGSHLLKVLDRFDEQNLDSATKVVKLFKQQEPREDELSAFSILDNATAAIISPKVPYIVYTHALEYLKNLKRETQRTIPRTTGTNDDRVVQKPNHPPIRSLIREQLAARLWCNRAGT